MARMTDEQLVSTINAYRSDSLGVDDGELTIERADAYSHYHGRPYGDEKEGRSQVVSRDLSETVDWIMPAVMKVFVSSDEIVEFMPEGMDDEEQAKQEGQYTNHVIMKENDGAIIVHDAVKDALLLKNGYFKHYWDESDKSTEYEYEGLTSDELMQLMEWLSSRGKVKILEQDEYELETELGPVMLANLRVRVTKTVGRCVIEAVPVEEVRVSKRCRGSLQTSPFTEHVTRKTRSELVEMGMSKDFVYSLPAATVNGDTDEISYSRDSVSDESDDYSGVMHDRSMDEIEFCEAYIRVDYDGDKIAELRKVVTVANKIPPGDRWNEVIDRVPMTGMVMKRVPHRHVGESLDDELKDLQRQKTILHRQLMDNIYLTNNQEIIVNERANIPDFMRRLPGGIKRITGDGSVHEAVMAVPATPILNQILPVIDYIDSVKANRTGIDKSTTGVDKDVLRESTRGAYMESLNRASQKVEMIIRMLAETGIKELVREVHGILLRHQDKAKLVKLRGRWAKVNPQEWEERDNLTVKVGIGTGNEEEKREKYMILSQLQDGLLQVGGASPMHKVNLFADISKAMGFDIPEKYSFSPEQIQQNMQQQAQQAQNQPNPLAEAEKVKGEMAMQVEQIRQQARMQIEQAKEQYRAQLQQYKDQADHEHKMHELQAEMTKQIRQILSDEAKAVLDAEVKLWLGGQKADLGQPGVGAGLQERTFNPETGAFI